ncbi:SLC13/DASS family transporter [bacterium]|nr:SLC13/DASS family transporter [bacterium]
MKRPLLLVLCAFFGWLSYFLLKSHFAWAPSAAGGLTVGVVMAWTLEALPLAVTALLVPCLASILGITSLEQAFSAFGHPLIFLFMGGFVIARGMAISGLDKRVALRILTAPGIKGKPWPTLLALLLVSGFFSMWISNTATTAMMLPIAAGVLNAIFPDHRKAQATFLISMAYASSIGGMATPIGSTPNILAIGLIRERLPEVDLSFFNWMLISTPLSLMILGLLILRIQKHLKELPSSFQADTLAEKLKGLGKPSKAERNSFIAILLAASIWILPSLFAMFSTLFPSIEGLSRELKSRFPEAVGAILGASVLFILPNEQGRPTLKWSEAVQIDWGSLMLFGGGLSLGSLIFSSGLGDIIGNAFVAQFGSAGFLLFLFAIILLSIMLTETTSNTATASLLIPLIMGATIKAGLPTVASALGVAWACSLAFMLPVATPPNAIVYGSGKIKLKEMIRLGFYMNIGATVIITVYLFALQKLGFLS